MAKAEGLEAAGGFLPRVIYGVIAEVAVVGMEFFQLAGEGAGVGGRECVGRDASPRRPRTARASRPYLAKSSHNVQHVQRPATF